MTRSALIAFCLAAIAGCSLSLGLNGDSNRPCLNGKCLDKFVCFKDVCVPGSGAECTTSNDCPSGTCVDGGCQLPPCADMKKNYRETDVDCGGGFCGTCKDGKRCGFGSDCGSKVCGAPSDGGVDGGSSDAGSADAGADGGAITFCLAPTCGDSELNGRETDVDCGGDGGCPRCADGKACAVGPDCLTGSCSGICQPGACIDLVKNGVETDVDCGGPCKKCIDGKGCLLGKDCVSGVCTAGILKCAVSTCADTVKNGAESDTDCGGGSCGGCADTRVCAAGTDCANGVCQNATCRPAHCNNGTKDVDESDKDCGGPCQKCGLAKSCGKDGDCDSNNCFSGYCIP